MAEGMDVFALALKLTTDGAEKMESTLESINLKGAGAASSLTSLAGVVGGLAAAFIVLEKASAFLSASVAAGEGNEQTFVRMGVAVQNAGVSFASARPEIDALLESLAGKSTFQVDQLGGAFTRLVQLTGNTGKSMKELGIVADFAAGRNIDLESAANLVGRAMNGNAIMLNRMLGLHGNAAQALATLTERYKGNAAALADVSASTLAANAMHELMEEIGKVILNEGGLKSATLSWTDVLKNAKRWVDEHREAIGNTVLAFISFGEAVGEIISTVMVPLQGAWILINVGIYAFIDVVQTIGPLFKLAAGLVLQSATEMMIGVASLVPGLSRVLDGVLKSVGATAKQMITDSTTALQANDAAFLDNVAALYKVDAVTNDYILKHKDLQKVVPITTEELEKQLGALSDLYTMHELSGPQWQKELAYYAELAKRVAAGNMTLEEEAKARKALAAAAADNTALQGPIIPQIDWTVGDSEVTKVSERMNAPILLGLEKSEKDGKAARLAKAKEWAASVQGELVMATSDIQQALNDQITSDWAQLGTNMATTITDSIGDAFKGGFGNALKTAEQGLGNIFMSMGKHMLMAAPPLKALETAMKNPMTASWAVAAAGVVLMALGATLSAIAGGGSGGGGGGGGANSSVAGAGTATGTAVITNITLAQTSAKQAANLPPMSQNNFTIIGSNDPTVHQPIIDLINNATGRGMMLSGATG